MQNTQTRENPLGYEKIPVLLRRFATPSVVAMLVSALYNIVDQIFIGRYVGTLGNAATNVAFPITTICIAISVLCGVGGASCFSIELGRGKKEEAKSCIGTALITAGVLGIVYALVSFFFGRGMLTLFGGGGVTLDYAVNYCKYLSIGIPFLILGNVMSNFIRADGSPKFSMVCMVSGGIVNIILDAVSQIFSFVLAAFYIKRFKSVKFRLREAYFSFRRAIQVCSLGMSNCVNQLAILVVQISMNNQLDSYGLLEYGEELRHIPQAAFGVVIKVNSILISFFVGMAQGSQPIVGFNYGANQWYRSKHTFRLSALICFCVAAVGFIIFQTVPHLVISIFGSGDSAYNEFAEKTMRIFLSMIMLNGVQMTISNYFSAIGKPIKGIILSLIRQVIIIVPLMIILPLYMGLDGVLYAAPITDFISFVVAAVMIIREFKLEGYKGKLVNNE